MVQFLLAAADGGTERISAKKRAAALILPLAQLQTEAGAKQAAAQAAGFPFICFTAAEAAAGCVLSAPAQHFAAQHNCLLLLPWAERETAGNSGAYWRRAAAAASAAGFRGLAADCAASPAGGRIAPAAYARALRQIKEGGLEAGLFGAWQAADMPRLLAFAPDYLVFAGKSVRAYAAAQAIMRAQQRQAFNAGKMKNGAEQNLPMDKILVSDFIVPMHIGAYAHEKTAAQRVCFNVAAEMLPPPAQKQRRPRGMADIFSYDIILDAILRMAAEGPVELAETAAENLAAFLLTYPQLARVTVRVEKLDLAARAVGVEISRSRAPAAEQSAGGKQKTGRAGKLSRQKSGKSA